MIMKLLVNLMPEQCNTCMKDYYHLVEEEPKVRCRRCARGACPDCYKEKVLHWHYLCNECDLHVSEQLSLPEDALTAKEKGKAKEPRGSQATQALQPSFLSQNLYETLSEEDEETDDDATREDEIEKKRQNENGGKTSEAKEKSATDEQKPICTAFKFGGKCPHGMNGKKPHGRWEECNKSHPKVCSKLMAHGTRGRLGCSGRNCIMYNLPNFPQFLVK